MTSRAAPSADHVSGRFIEAVNRRLSENKSIRRRLPVWGRVHIDRQLPFLCVYRRPVHGLDAGTDRLVTTEASYLVASAAPRLHAGLSDLVTRIARTLAEQFGGMLVLEVWASQLVPAGDGEATPPDAQAVATPSPPAFRIVAPRGGAGERFLATFEAALIQIRQNRQRAQVAISRSSRWHPGRFMPILPTRIAGELGCTVIGLEVTPIYRHPATGELYPLVLRQSRRALSRALRRAFFHFARHHTKHRPRHYQVLGRRAVVKAVWDVDRRLADVASRFDFLLQVTPTNSTEAWNAFKRSRYGTTPRFHYRPLATDPSLLKRRLYDTPIERVEDPALAFLLREKQEELDRQITMLQDLDTRRFVHGSLQLYGELDQDLVEHAASLLDRIPARTRDDSRGGHMDAAAFAELAREEIARYRAVLPELDARVELRDDIASGLMVSRGSLLVSRNAQIPKLRAEALVQHEIGTHVLTYHNGKVQPFRQLSAGLAGYEAFQEGLAVLAEYLVGGLSRPRLRLLAARVHAVHNLVNGASFLDTFRDLVRDHGYRQQSAFTVTTRVYRGGGLTKDASYLRGLVQVIDYLGREGDLAPLYVGKIAVDHVSIITELLWRKVLHEPPLVPRCFEHPEASERLATLRAGCQVSDLVRGF